MWGCFLLIIAQLSTPSYRTSSSANSQIWASPYSPALGSGTSWLTVLRLLNSVLICPPPARSALALLRGAYWAQFCTLSIRMTAAQSITRTTSSNTPMIPHDASAKRITRSTLLTFAWPPGTAPLSLCEKEEESTDDRIAQRMIFLIFRRFHLKGSLGIKTCIA